MNQRADTHTATKVLTQGALPTGVVETRRVCDTGRSH